jgi:hypothetical protein
MILSEKQLQDLIGSLTNQPVLPEVLINIVQDYLPDTKYLTTLDSNWYIDKTDYFGYNILNHISTGDGFYIMSYYRDTMYFSYYNAYSNEVTDILSTKYNPRAPLFTFTATGINVKDNIVKVSKDRFWFRSNHSLSYFDINERKIIDAMKVPTEGFGSFRVLPKAYDFLVNNKNEVLFMRTVRYNNELIFNGKKMVEKFAHIAFNNYILEYTGMKLIITNPHTMEKRICIVKDPALPGQLYDIQNNTILDNYVLFHNSKRHLLVDIEVLRNHGNFLDIKDNEYIEIPADTVPIMRQGDDIYFKNRTVIYRLRNGVLEIFRNDVPVNTISMAFASAPPRSVY